MTKSGILSFAFLSIVVAGCSASSSLHQEANAPEFVATEDGVAISEQALRSLQGRVSAYQLAMIEDRILTFAEYEAAYLASRQCALDLGFEITEEHPPSMLSVGGFGLFHPGPDDATKRAAEECIVEYRGELQRIWGRVHGPSEAQLQEARDFMGSCLREFDPNGTPDHPTEQDLAVFLKVRGEERALHWAACLERSEKEFGFPVL